jgi:hypothetical protein
MKLILLIFKATQKSSENLIDIKLPLNVVPQSARMNLVVTGDAIGAALNNLDKLVQQPTGCGEQNMVKFAPIVSVVEYLKQTDQLTSAMDKLTKDYLKIGNLFFKIK